MSRHFIAFVAAGLFASGTAFAAGTDTPVKPAGGGTPSAASAPKKNLNQGTAKVGVEKAGSDKPVLKGDTTPNTSSIKVPPKPKVPADKVPAAAKQ